MTKKEETKIGDTPQLTCGLIMPISTIDGLNSEHWVEIKSIVQDAVHSIESPKFVAKLVSDADDVGVIQKRIVQGVYNSDVVVCDVSAKNSNVMFELGMRLAFDKPTVIIKDDKTDYSFDTSIIEHIPYPRDLRFSKIVTFKKQLADKVLATYKSSSDINSSTFLKNFGEFKIAELKQTVGSSEQLMLEMLSDLQREMSQLRRTNTIPSARSLKAEVAREKIRSELLDIFNLNPQLNFELNDDIVVAIEKKLPAFNYFNSSDEFGMVVNDVYNKLKNSLP